MSPSPRRLAGRLLLALAPLLVLLLLAELALWALDLGRGLPLDRGFDPTVAYLLPDRSVRGAWRTNVFGDPAREVRVPPEDGRRRVLLFGGSNTQLFPGPVLQDDLDALDPDPGWEVVNLGREGYGSDRVAILLAQAMVLTPDVVVIYAGHNEFVEHHFAEELETAWGSPVTRAAAGVLSHLRLFRALVDLLTPLAPPPPLDPPPLDRGGGPGPRDMPMEQTRRFYAAYRENLERMVDSAERAGAQVVLCTLVSNQLMAPWGFEPEQDVDPDLMARFRDELAAGLAAIPPVYRVGVRPALRLRVKNWYDGPPTARSVAPLRALTGPLGATPACDDPLCASVAGAHWPDPAAWDPDVVTVIGTVRHLLERDLQPGEQARLQAGRAHLQAALALQPTDPRASFDLGLTDWLLGDEQGAVSELQHGLDLDRAPKAANGPIDAAVRAVAAAHPDVVLLDARHLFAERCPAGLVTYEVMMDANHLQPGARVVLMGDLAGAIAGGH